MATALEGSRSGPSRVFEQLRRMIIEGEYGPEERLIEEQVAERLGVSRTPVRQALTMLEAEGLVEIQPNKGAMVCSFSVEDVMEVYDLRAVLEGHATRRAAEEIGTGQLARLEELAAEMEGLSGRYADRGEEIRRLVVLNNEFHGTILEASQNRRLGRLVRRVVEIPLVYKAFFRYGSHERVMSNHYHRQILKALRDRDPERAEIVMREHVYEGRDFVVRALEEDGGE